MARAVRPRATGPGQALPRGSARLSRSGIALRRPLRSGPAQARRSGRPARAQGRAPARSRASDRRHQLVREWKGIEHVVTVREHDFEYNGRPYKSLSAIAREIAGTRWNGWLFFGLRRNGTGQMNPPPRKVRCAIIAARAARRAWTRRSTPCTRSARAALNYVRSQAHEGWIAVDDQYDDAGFSGGTLERPALRRLLRDIEADKIDAVVCYRIDRLTRSLTDFPGWSRSSSATRSRWSALRRTSTRRPRWGD